MRFEHGRVPQGAGLGFRENARAQAGPSLGPVWFVVWGDNGRFCLIDSDFFPPLYSFLVPRAKRWPRTPQICGRNAQAMWRFPSWLSSPLGPMVGGQG